MYCQNKIFPLKLCLQNGLCREDSPYHEHMVQWTQPFFQIKLRGRAITLASCPRHQNATLAVHVHANPGNMPVSVHARVSHLRPSLRVSWREKIAQDYTPWLSWVWHQEGKQLHMFNKQVQRSHRINVKKQLLKWFAKSFSTYLFIFWMAQSWRMKDRSVIRELQETNILHSKANKPKQGAFCSMNIPSRSH